MLFHFSLQLIASATFNSAQFRSPPRADAPQVVSNRLEELRPCRCAGFCEIEHVYFRVAGGKSLALPLVLQLSKLTDFAIEFFQRKLRPRIIEALRRGDE